MKIGDHIFVIIIVLLVTIAFSKFLMLPMFLLIGLGVLLSLFCIGYFVNMRVLIGYSNEDIKSKKNEISKYWNIVENNPDILKNNQKLGFQ